MPLGVGALFSLEPEVPGVDGHRWKTRGRRGSVRGLGEVGPADCDETLEGICTRTNVRLSGEKLPNRGEKHLELMVDEGEWARATFLKSQR